MKNLKRNSGKSQVNIIPFIYLNFTAECNLKFQNNILETKYDKMHQTASQAMNSETVLTENSENTGN
jgi:hypothetical protein